MVRRRSHVPEAGIYQIAGTHLGEESWIAYDREGEHEIRHGAGAFQQLELWLRDRGVNLDASRPLLFLVRILLCSCALGQNMRWELLPF